MVLTKYAPIVVTLAFAALAQASLAQSIEGAWKVTGAKVQPGSNTTVTFRGGKVAARISRSQGGRVMRIDATGTYTYKGGQLTTKMTDASLDPTPFTAAERKQLFTPQAKANFKKMMTRSAGPEGTVRFLDKNRFELKSKKGPAVTFTRVR